MTDVDPKPEPQPKPKVDDTLDKFNEIKARFEKELSDKDKKIQELEKKLSEKDNEVNDVISNLNDEVNEKLQQAEELKALQANVNELLNDKANALVDKYISEGKLVPAQKEKALQLCLADQDMFISLYEDAQSVIDTNLKPKSHKVLSNVDKMVDYFKYKFFLEEESL
jgi:phage I-like protein